MGDNVGLGLVGSMTFCLAGDKLEDRSSEDAYAAHCYWELEARGLVTEAEVDEDSTEYNGMLRQIKLAGLGRPRIVRVVELSPALKYPQCLVAWRGPRDMAKAVGLSLTDREAGGTPSPRAPGDQTGRLTVMIHVGRVLLDFGDGLRSTHRIA